MFINALSWKKFNSNKKKSSEGNTKNKSLAFRTPLDNIHPIVDNNKNIQNALCHGTKNTSLVDGKRNLDIVRNPTAPQAATTHTGDVVRNQTNKLYNQGPPQQPPVPTNRPAPPSTGLVGEKLSNLNITNNNTIKQD